MKEDNTIKKEISRYKSIFKNLDKDKKKFADKWIEQAVFMDMTLKELQETIKEEGAVIESTNGNGFTTYNEHPAQKSYNVMIKNYNATINHLLNLLPKDNNTDDELINFIKR